MSAASSAAGFTEGREDPTLEETRRRNREHAKRTRMRKREYVEKLENTVKHLVEEKSRRDHSRSLEHSLQQSNLEQLRTRVAEFLQFLFTGQPAQQWWLHIASANVRFSSPVTPFRSHNPFSVSSGMQTVVGVVDVVKEAASWSLFFGHWLGCDTEAWKRARLESQKTKLEIQVWDKDAQSSGPNFYGSFSVRTLNARTCGCKEDIAFHGMVHATFDMITRAPLESNNKQAAPKSTGAPTDVIDRTQSGFRKQPSSTGAATPSTFSAPPSASSNMASDTPLPQIGTVPGLSANGRERASPTDVRVTSLEIVFDVMSLMQHLVWANPASSPQQLYVPNTRSAVTNVSWSQFPILVMDVNQSPTDFDLVVKRVHREAWQRHFQTVDPGQILGARFFQDLVRDVAEGTASDAASCVLRLRQAVRLGAPSAGVCLLRSPASRPARETQEPPHARPDMDTRQTRSSVRRGLAEDISSRISTPPAQQDPLHRAAELQQRARHAPTSTPAVATANGEFHLVHLCVFPLWDDETKELASYAGVVHPLTSQSAKGPTRAL
uniref:BZIP domain-containing protein n=1 Tax=Rhizochromulina marina TaxID=1034831 RepID=A0A7S2RG98_9STRA